MRVVVGIDGTGPFWTSSYEPEFKSSFVKRLCPDHEQDDFASTYYRRGPDTAGGGIAAAINGCEIFIRNRRVGKPGGPRLLVTGYSRGAFAILVLAQRLQKLGIEIDAALLFDAVDRYYPDDAETVPSNVKFAMHFRRSPRSQSRGTFKNCGTEPEDGGKTWYRERYCLCTHGGVGGTPWKPRAAKIGRSIDRGNHPQDLIDEGLPDGLTKVTYAQDARVSEQVWIAAQPFIKRHGFTNLAATIPTPSRLDEDDYSDLGTPDVANVNRRR